MKLKNINLLACAVMLFTVTACNDDTDTASFDDRVAVSVEAGFIPNSNPATYASNGAWDKNDVIGLTMLNLDGKEVINNIFNYVYNTPSGTIKFVPRSADNTAYFPQDGKDVKIKAYYPYSAQLGSDMKASVAVLDQTKLPLIDFMTAEHLSGFSKAEPAVHLNFHHRLSQLIFNLSITDDDKSIPLKDFELTIKGMNTTASYDLFAEALTVDAGSAKNIAVPLRGKEAERNGIVLPRPAGAGVVFEFKAPNGSVYSAKMSPELVLQGGYKYTFNIKLQKTPLTVSATIEEWIDGATTNHDALDVSTPAGASKGVKEGDVMKVYLKKDADFSLLKSFTYKKDGKWLAESPVYWVDIANPAVLRSSIIAVPALNSTQLADILISEELSVPRNTGANFVLKHAASKVIVKLTSTTFTDADLDKATITLPNFLTGGKEENGLFVAGTTKADITVDRTDKKNAIALFQPQAIAKGNNVVVKVTINGRDYTADASKAEFDFKAGVAQVLTLNIGKTEATVSAVVVDWVTETKELDAITVGTPASGAVGVLDKEEMEVYTGTSSARDLLTTFAYNLGANTWTSATSVYWENIISPSTFYASILRTKQYNATQLDDYLIAKPVSVTASNGVKFDLAHASAKVVIELISSDGSFVATDLEKMDITLPNYANGATVDKGVFTAGTGKGDVTIAKNVGEDGKSAIALIQAQTIAAGANVANVIDPATGRIYKVATTSQIIFKAGVATVLKIDMNKTLLTVSANVVDWEVGSTISLVPAAITIGGTLDNTADFFKNKKIYVYKLAPKFSSSTYSYLPKGSGFAWSGGPLYWDDQALPFNVTAIHFPAEELKPTIESATTQFAWKLPEDQSKGYEKYDLLTHYISLASPEYVNFKFTHAMSKAKVEISSDEFTAAQLLGTKIVLNSFVVEGSVKMADGKVVSGTATKDVVVKTDTNGSKYSALVMPQTIKANVAVVTVTLTDYPNTPFVGKLTTDLNFVAGKETVIKLKLKRTAIELSATLEAWTPGELGGIIIE